MIANKSRSISSSYNPQTVPVTPDMLQGKTRDCPLRGKKRDCPLRDVLDRVGDKWSVLVVLLLRDGKLRFSELSRSIEGISQRMLTHTLRQLERDGLVGRTVYPSVPMRVEYELTVLGRTLIEPVTALAQWAQTYQTVILSARVAYDSREDL